MERVRCNCGRSLGKKGAAAIPVPSCNSDTCACRRSLSSTNRLHCKCCGIRSAAAAVSSFPATGPVSCAKGKKKREPLQRINRPTRRPTTGAAFFQISPTPRRHPRQVPSAGRMERILHCRRSGRDVGQGRSTLPVGNGCATTCSDGGGGPRPFWTPGGEEGLVRRFPRSIPRQVGRERGHVVQGACLGGGGGCKRGSSSGKAKPNERYTAESVFHEAAEK